SCPPWACWRGGGDGFAGAPAHRARRRTVLGESPASGQGRWDLLRCHRDTLSVPAAGPNGPADRSGPDPPPPPPPPRPPAPPAPPARGALVPPPRRSLRRYQRRRR